MDLAHCVDKCVGLYIDTASNYMKLGGRVRGRGRRTVGVRNRTGYQRTEEDQVCYVYVPSAVMKPISLYN